MSKENILDKYNVSVNSTVAKTINQDLINFNIKSRNAIYNQIIINIYEYYKHNRNKHIENIISVLRNNSIDNEKSEIIAIQLADYKFINVNKINKIKQKKEVLPLKVNTNAKRVIEMILNSIDDENTIINSAKCKSIDSCKKKSGSDGNKVSEYLRQIFTFYASLTTYEREMLLFSEKVNIILEAINNNVTVDMNGIKEKINFRLKPVAITTSVHNAYVVGIVEYQDVSINNRYQLCSLKVNELANYRTRKERQDLYFDRNYVLEKYKNIIDDDFLDIFNKLNMIVDLASKYDFIYDKNSDCYLLDIAEMTKKDRGYYFKLYKYKGEIVKIPSRFMDTVISIPVKLNFMLHHDSEYAYKIEESGLVSVKYNEFLFDEYSKCLPHKLETIREFHDNIIVYETTVQQATDYFKGLEGFTILYPNELKNALIDWHKRVMKEL